MALPSATAVTTPVWSTVATAVSLEDHVTVLLVALAGATVAVRVPVWPGLSGVSHRVRETPVTGTADVSTVTAQAAVLPPSAVVTVMLALPFATAVTTPVWSTVATPELLEAHVTVLLLAI